MECEYEIDGFCVNDQCPQRGDCCPVPDVSGLCRHEKRVVKAYKLTPRGCALAALQKAGASLTYAEFDVFWEEFSRLMTREGYVNDGTS